MDDLPTAELSAEKLDGYTIMTVYPGHGEPFQWAEYQASLKTVK
jgi:hypothetical protein